MILTSQSQLRGRSPEDRPRNHTTDP